MRTKKIFYSSVLALALSACINETIQSPVSDSGKAVGFGTVLAPSTRGTVFTKDSLQKEANGFSVSAYNTGATGWTNYSVLDKPDFMDNDKVTWNSSTSTWAYSPIRYWPGKVNSTDYGKVTFFALAGRGKNDNTITYNSSSNKPEFSYTTAATAADQKDLVADVLFDEQWSSNKKVSFQFKHILSKIGFSAKLNKQYDGATVKVTHLQVNYTANKIISSGTYAFGVSGTDHALGSWTPDATCLSGNSGELISSEVTLNNGTTPAVSTLNDANKFLMLIPQTTPSVDAGDLTVELTYTITTGTSPKEKTVTCPVTYKLPQYTYVLGTQYIYNFILTLNPVEFDVNLGVADWTEPTSQPGDITIAP